MRLTCPNCNAQYQVDDSVIPDEGRDVQCSNCGKTWFQESANALAAKAAAVQKAAEPPATEPAPRQDEPEPEVETFVEPEVDFDDTETWEDDEPPAPEPAVAPRSSVDESIAGILREEAERETAARKAASERLGEPLVEQQPAPTPQPEPEIEHNFPEPELEDEYETDTSLETETAYNTEPSKDADGAPQQEFAPVVEEPEIELPVAETETETETETATYTETDTDDDQLVAQVHNYYEEVEEAEEAAPATEARSTLLPDIEEINSTLSDVQDDDEYEDDGENELEPRRRGFRRGYVLTLLVFAIMALAYAYAPKIVETVPEAEPYMIAYVQWINDLRVNVDELMRLAADKLTDLAGGISG